MIGHSTCAFNEIEKYAGCCQWKITIKIVALSFSNNRYYDVGSFGSQCKTKIKRTVLLSLL